MSCVSWAKAEDLGRGKDETGTYRSGHVTLQIEPTLKGQQVQESQFLTYYQNRDKIKTLKGIKRESILETVF